MRLPRFRFTIRWMMIAVGVASIDTAYAKMAYDDIKVGESPQSFYIGTAIDLLCINVFILGLVILSRLARLGGAANRPMESK